MYNEYVCIYIYTYMGVCKNKGTPKWMVYNGKLIKMDHLGEPLFLETPIYMSTFCILVQVYIK